MPTPPEHTRRRLPPLTALRAFEAAARHMSVTQAAHELSVTPAAVSQQIRQLEENLGRQLFRKQGRSLILTEDGRQLLPGLNAAFDQLAAAVDSLGPRNERPVVRVSVPPSLADRWLMPRLSGFLEAHPGIDVHLTASMGLTDFSRDAVDVAVRFGTGAYPGLVVERLKDELVFPVCAPSLLEKGPALKRPEDLRNHVLIHDDNPAERKECPDWEMWLAAAGIKDVPTDAGLRFNLSSHVLDAAVRGMGVALARAFLADTDLREGRLVRLFARDSALRFAYYVVGPEDALKRPEVRAFRDWLFAEVGDMVPHAQTSGT